MLVDDTLSHNPMYGYLHRLGGSARYFRNPGSAGGWGPGVALGVKLGMPQRDVVLVTGDGFWMYGSPTAALWSARQYGAPFLSVIFQNRSYSTGTRATAALYPGGHAVSGGLEGGYFDPPMDFALEAQAAGAYGENVRDPAEVVPALMRGLEKIRTRRPGCNFGLAPAHPAGRLRSAMSIKPMDDRAALPSACSSSSPAITAGRTTRCSRSPPAASSAISR